ncbi:MAG: DUF4374 domain-containing protein [Polyangiales bacterium]
MRSHHFAPCSTLVSSLALCAAIGFTACSDDDAKRPPESSPDAAAPDAAAPDAGEPDASAQPDAAVKPAPLVVVTERESPEAALQYLHVVADWPQDGELDYSQGIELGEFVNVHAEAGAVFVYQPEAGVVTKYEVNDALEISQGDRLSFMSEGIFGFDAEPIWVSPELAFMLDEKSAQIARWNPRTMVIEDVESLEPSVLERNGLAVQFQQGIAAGKRLFTAVNWRDWETYKTEPGVTLGIFDQDTPSDAPTLLTDERCAPSIALNPFTDADGNVYVIGDGGLGFDLLASPMKTSLPQCVLRVRPGADVFDPDFFIDVREVTGSPAFYTAHPMADHKLLVNMWSPDVDVEEIADPKDPGWYWAYPPYFEYAIIDLETGTSRKVEALERAAVQFSITLRVDDQNFVQLYRQDGGSSLHRVDPDGTVTQVLESPSGTDVQYLGRL